MAIKKDAKEQVKLKNSTRQKIIVEQGRAMGSPKVDYKVLYTEIVESNDKAKERVNELKKEYKNVDALSVHYFSL